MRVLSISTLFPNPVRPLFGIFVGNQMRAVTRRGDVELTMVSPNGHPPWPLSLRDPYASLRGIPEASDSSGLPVHYPRFATIPLIGGTSGRGAARGIRSAQSRHGSARHARGQDRGALHRCRSSALHPDRP